MADASLDSPDENDDLPVAIDTLEIDGTRPQVGDKVELKVAGTISSIVDQAAFVTPETVNDQPIPTKATAPEGDQLRANAMQSDMQDMQSGY